jgi:VanZ family protein
MLIYAALTRFVSKKKALVIAPTVTLAIAVFDEFVIQRISSGRSPEWRDVIIDLCGALLATAILSLRFFLKSKKEEGKNDNA